MWQLNSVYRTTKAWKARFFTIWGGQALSLLGSQLVGFAIVWYLTVKTGSATVLAAASLVRVLPGIIFGPFIGSLVDRWNRRIVMLVSDTIIALVTLFMAYLFARGIIEIWHFYVLLFIRAVFGNFQGNAMGASTSLMVPVEHMPRIQGLNQMLNGGLNVISAPLGALVYAALPLQSILLLDAGSALFAILPLIFFLVPQPKRQLEENGEVKKTSFKQDFIEGFQYIWSWKGLFFIALMAMGLNLLLNPAMALIPFLVEDFFSGDALQLATLESIFGISVIFGGLLLSIWGGFKRRILTTMAGLIAFGLGSLLLGFAPANAFYLAIIAAGIMGFFLPIMNGALDSILAENVAPEMQGRVFGLLRSMASAMSPLGYALSGPLTDLLGAKFWYLFGGLVYILMGISGFLIPAIFNIEENNPKKAKMVIENQLNAD